MEKWRELWGSVKTRIGLQRLLGRLLVRCVLHLRQMYASVLYQQPQSRAVKWSSKLLTDMSSHEHRPQVGLGSAPGPSRVQDAEMYLISALCLNGQRSLKILKAVTVPTIDLLTSLTRASTISHRQL